MTILMCRPEFFGVEYEINPWMHVENAVDRATALAQWQRLHDTYRAMGEEIELVEPVRGLPDMVFTANAGVVWNNRAVVSRFRHPERQGEEKHFLEFFERHGMEIREIGDVAFEGAGDALFLGETLFCGWGFRTDRESHEQVAKALDVEVVSLQLVDARFYHLDTCFCPLDDTTALFAPVAFSEESVARIRELVPNPIEVPDDVATGFACNAMPLGDVVVSSESILKLEAPLRAEGWSVTGLPMTEFMKSGGGVRCLSLPLEIGRVVPQTEPVHELAAGQ